MEGGGGPDRFFAADCSLFTVLRIVQIYHE